MKVNKKALKGHGKSYINIRAKGVIRVKAKTKEEALDKAKDKFEEMIGELAHDTFPQGLLEHWSGLLGVEVTKGKKGTSEITEFKWQNKAGGEWVNEDMKKQVRKGK
jgi:hypothetical protein